MDATPDRASGPETDRSLSTRIPAAILAGLAALAVIALSFLGSRGFKDFDAALVGYFVALVFAAAALVYRYSLWITRPPTWRYFKAGWANFFSVRNFRRYGLLLPRAIWHDLIAQTFLLKRGRSRWLTHQAIFWGVLGSLAITVPLTLGWFHFSLVPPDRYELWFFGFPMFQFPIEAGTGFAVFHGLDWTALVLLVGLGGACWKRIRDVGSLTTQRFGFDLMPLALLAAVAITGLLLTASSTWWDGRYYWFVSLTHQVVVVGWILSLPFGKFFHIIQRPASIGVTLYQTVNQDLERDTGRCRGCDNPLPSQQFISDLKATLADLHQDYDLGSELGALQDYCPTCKRRLRGRAYYQLLGKRFL
ncbi:MAG TPA: hypothetical protein V6D05_04225 [Stenomitos sp.]